MAPKKKDRGDAKRGGGRGDGVEASIDAELTEAEKRVLEAEAARRKEELETTVTSLRDPSATPSKADIVARTRGRRLSETEATLALRDDALTLDRTLAFEVVEESYAARQQGDGISDGEGEDVPPATTPQAKGAKTTGKGGKGGSKKEEVQQTPEELAQAKAEAAERALQWETRKTRGDSARGERPEPLARRVRPQIAGQPPRARETPDPDALVDGWRQEYNIPKPVTPPPEPKQAFEEEVDSPEQLEEERAESPIDFSEFDDLVPPSGSINPVGTTRVIGRTSRARTAQTQNGTQGLQTGSSESLSQNALAAQARNERLEIAKAKRYRIQCERDLAAKEAASRLSEEELRAAQDRMRQLSLEHEEAIQTLHNAPANVRPVDLKVLEDKVEMAAALMRAQQDVIIAQERNNDQCIRDLVDAEARVRENTLVAAKIADVEAGIAAEQERIAKQRHRQAVRIKKKAEAAQEARRIQEEEEARVEGERQRDALAKAQTGQLRARMRLRAAQRDIKKLEDENQSHQQALLERRKQAVLELRKHTDEALNKLKGSNQRRRKRLEAQRQAEEDEKQQILAVGGNPYEVFRRRAENARLEKEIQRRAEALRASELQATQAVFREDEEFKKREKVRLREKEAKEKHQSEMGNAAPRVRVQKYMAAVAADSASGILDPTSRQRELLPSKFTNAKTWKFGMGGVDPKLLERIKKKYPDAMYDEKTLRRLMGPAKAQPPKPKDDDLILASSVKAAKQALAEASDGESSEEEVFALASDQGLWADGGQVEDVEAALEAKRAAEPKLSKMEEQMLERARARQKQNLTKSQIVLGREFKGQAFISKPDKVIFKDFEVGNTYTQTIVLTNVSFSINSFKLEGLGDDITDFFEFQYKPPGQMSAGLTCKMTITFTPKKHADIHSNIRLISMTGPILIPLECTTKKTVISAVPAVLDFGPVVLGERVTRSFKVVNQGALPSNFTVVYPKTLDPDVTMVSLVPSYHEENPEDAIPDEDFEFADPEYDQFLEGLREEFAGPDLGLPSPPESMRTASTAASSEGSEESLLSIDPHGDGSVDAVFNMDQLLTSYRAQKAGANVRSTRLEPSAMSTFRSTYSRLFGDEDDQSSIRRAKPQPIFQGTTEGVSEPYSTTLINVTFTPFKVEDYMSNITVNFESKAAENVELRVRGEGIDVPIYVEREVLDFQVCSNDVLYRDNLTIHNRSKTALKCTVEEVPELQGYLDILPKVGFVQGKSSFNMQVKFKPRAGLLRQAARYANPQTGILEVPMRLDVPDQALPVYFLFRAQMTTNTIKIHPRTLDFGRVAAGESVRLPFKITNTSALPQRFGFPHKPSYVSITPDNGFGTLLPHETQYKNLVFSPQVAMDYDFKAVLKTLNNRDFTIKCTGTAYSPWLTFEPKSVIFAAAAIGDAKSTFIRVTNPTRNPLIFEFVPPENSNISVSPQLGQLGPKETRRLFVEFKPDRNSMMTLRQRNANAGVPGQGHEEIPPPDDDDAAAKEDNTETAAVEAEAVVDKKDSKKKGGKADKKDTKDKKDSKDKKGKDNSKVKGKGRGGGKKGKNEPEPPAEEDEEDKDPSVLAEADIDPDADRATWCFTKEWSLPCFVTTEADSEKRSDKDVSLVRLGIKTVAVKPLVLPENAKGQRIRALSFGSVSLGKPVTQAITLRNHSAKTVHYTMDCLDPNGVFSVINALRPIPSGGTHQMLVKFAPTTESEYIEHLILHTNDANDVNLRISGTGVSPALQADPPGPDLDMGDVAAHGFLERTLTLSNGSPFDVKYTATIRDISHQNHSRLLPFDCTPCDKVIPRDSQQKVTLRFAPDHEYHDYRAQLVITVADQSQTLTMNLHGRGWERGVFITGGDHVTRALPNPFLLPAAKPVEEKGAPKAQATAAPVQEVRLSFHDPGMLPDTPAIEQSFSVGNPKAGHEKKANADVTVDSLSPAALAAGFTCETSKLSVESGSVKPVVFKYRPSAEYQLAHRGQWVEFEAKCVLKGGTPPPPTADGYRVTVTLRGYCADTPGLVAAVAAAREAGNAGGGPVGKGKKK